MPVEVQAIGKSKGQVDILGPIGGTDTNAKHFAEQLKALGSVSQIDVNIASPGGSVSEGLAIYSQLKSHPATVHANIQGMAFSMASYIAMAADKVSMSSNGLMMIHNPRSPIAGEAKDLRARADMMDKMKSVMSQGYADKSGKSTEEIDAILDSETWLDAREAKAAGFVDEITDAATIAAEFDSIPDDLRVPAHVSGQFYALFGSSEQPEINEAPQGAEEMAKAATPEAIPAAEPQGPVAATLEELKELKGADDSFVVAQMSAGATLVEAQNELNAILLERLEAKDAEIEQVKAAAPEVVTHGVDGLSTGSPGASTAPEAIDNPKAAYRKLMDDKKRDCIALNKTWNAVDASQEIRAEHPEIFEAMGVKAQGKYWEQDRKGA